MKVTNKWTNILSNVQKFYFTSSLVTGAQYFTYFKEAFVLTDALIFSKLLSYLVIKSFAYYNLRRPKFSSQLLGFSLFRFVLFSGLGYKRRAFKRYKVMFAYIGDRHWIVYKLNKSFNIFPNKRRNYIFFSHTKGLLIKDYEFFNSLKKPQVYKMKGFLDTRVRGRFLFVRRIKIKGVRTKLSKKQKLL